MHKILSAYFFYYFTVSSVLRFILVLLFSNQKPISLGERRVRRMVSIGILCDILHLLLIAMFHAELKQTTIDNFFFFTEHIRIIWSSYAIAFFVFSIGTICLVSRFSSYYLHRDTYFYKFFALIFVLEFAVCLLILTSTSESIFIGWELLGLSSVLLIAFYEHRMSVLKSALVILVIYKLSDVVFYSALISASYYGNRIYMQINNQVLELMILCACLIKSSIFPWLWLPRAMEGPTPSSALFYGGIATHIPMFIFLNISMSHAHYVTGTTITLVIFLAFGSILTSLIGKQATDVKSSIAYTSIAQLGIIYIEILFQYYTLALFHGIANGLYGTLCYLKAPSLLQKKLLIERLPAKVKGHGSIISFFPYSVQRVLYRASFHQFYLPRLIMHSIELFLGLPNSRTKSNSVRNYFFISLSLYTMIEGLIYSLLKIEVNFADEMLLLLALSFNFIATLYKYRPFYFFTLILISTLAVFTVLFEHLQGAALHVEWLYLIFTAYFCFHLLSSNISTTHPVNYTGRLYKSTKINILIFITGISLIGIPGLTSYMIWEHLESKLLPHYPNLIVSGFFILALNTVLFFRFYFANFLGQRIKNTLSEITLRL